MSLLATTQIDDPHSRITMLPSDQFRLLSQESGNFENLENAVFHQLVRGIKITQDVNSARVLAILSGQYEIPGIQVDQLEVAQGMDISTAAHIAVSEQCLSDIYGRLFGSNRKLRRQMSKILCVKQDGIVPKDFGNPSKQLITSYLDENHVVRLWRAHSAHTRYFMQRLLTNETSHLHEAEQSIKASESDFNSAVEMFKEIIELPDVKYIYGADLQSLLDTCILCCTNSNANAQLVVGFGGSPDEPTARLPSYLVSALRIINIFAKYKNTGLVQSMPRLRILDASRIGAEENNGMNKDAVIKAGEDRMGFIAAFLQEFAPDIVFEIIKDDPRLIPTRENAVAIHDEVEWPEHYISALEKQVERMVSKDRLKAELQDARERVVRYVVAHPILFEDIVEHKSPLLTDAQITIGGRGEMFFNIGRSLLVTQWPSNVYRPIGTKIIAKAGQYPPYYKTSADTPLANINGAPLSPLGSDKVCRKYVAEDYVVLWDYLAHVLDCSPEQAENQYREFLTFYANQL